MKCYFIVGLLIFFGSCHPKQKFDKIKWANQGDLTQFPYRKHMIDDLLNSIPLKGKTYPQIITMLGNPQMTVASDTEFSISYEIDIDYGTDIDPVYIKNLRINFSMDSTVRDTEVNEWKK